MLPPSLPKKLTMAQARDYVNSKYSRNFTRMTLQNWRTKGRRGRKLACTEAFGQYYTTEKALDDFIAGTD